MPNDWDRFLYASTLLLAVDVSKNEEKNSFI